jgi:hypothetical protein
VVDSMRFNCYNKLSTNFHHNNLTILRIIRIRRGKENKNISSSRRNTEGYFIDSFRIGQKKYYERITR